MKPSSVHRLVRTGSDAARHFALAIAVLLGGNMAQATDIVLGGGTVTYSGTATGTQIAGINGSVFLNTPDNFTPVNLDGASFTMPLDRVLAGTQANTILATTPNYNALLIGAINNWDGFSGFNGNADHFVSAFSGTFTPQVSGSYNFQWSNDDRGFMYMDLNHDRTLTNDEQVAAYAWTSSGNVTLTAGTAYTYIYMTQEFGGAQNNWWRFTPPGGSATVINPSDPAQAGIWNVSNITYGPLSFAGQNLNVNADTTLQLNASPNIPFALLNANTGTATITGVVPSLSFTGTFVAAAATSGIASGAAVTLGPVTLGSGGTLIANGSGTKSATSLTLSGASGGINAEGRFNLGTYSDGGSPKTLTLGGAGTKVMDNSSGGIVAAHTTLQLTGGSLDTTATAAGANDPLGGAMTLQLANSKLLLQGQQMITNDALKITEYNLSPSGDLMYVPSGNSLLAQSSNRSAMETGLVRYSDNAGDWGSSQLWTSTFPGLVTTHAFEVMWQGQFRPTATDNYNIGDYGADDAETTWIKIDGTWQQLSGSWRALTAGVWYDIAIMYGNWGGGAHDYPVMQRQNVDSSWKNITMSGFALGDWRTQTLGALDLSGRSVRLDASSEIATMSDSAVAFNTLTVNNGVLTLSGAPSTSFASTSVSAAATQIGFNSAAAILAGPITGNSATATFVKAGAGTLTLNSANTGLANVMFDVQGGSLAAVSPNSLGGSTSDQLSGGNLMLSSTGGDVSYNLSTTVTQNSSLTAGKATGGTNGPLTVSLGSAGKVLSIQNGQTLTVTATDSYALNINNSINLQENASLTVNGTGVNINNLGATTLTMGSNSTINLNSGALTTDKALDVYNLNLNGGLLTQTGNGAAKNLNVRGTLTVNNPATNLQITGAANLTSTSNATIDLVAGTLTTDKSLNVGNLTIESAGTLNRSGTGSAKNITVSGKLRLNNQTMDTTGATLSVGDRIELSNSTLTCGNALTFNSFYMDGTSTFNPGAPTTINGQIEIYNASTANFTDHTLNTNWQNVYIQGSGTQLTVGGNLNVNFLQIWDGGTLNAPSVTIQDRIDFHSTDSRYGNNTYSFSIAGHNGTSSYIRVFGGGFDRNPSDGSTDIYLTGVNSYAGITQILDNTVLVADDGVGLPSASSIQFNNGGVLGTHGSFTRSIGDAQGGQVVWNGGWGGFAGYGGDLTVSLATVGGGANAPLAWNSYTDGFNNQGLFLGSTNATNNVTLTNAIEINSYAQINTSSRTTLATLTGNLTGDQTLDKQGSGTLVLTGDNSGFSGRQYIRRGVLDVGLNGSNLGSGRIDLQADTSDPYWKGAILQAHGVLNKTIGNDNGNLHWEDNGGGFAARGGSLSVTLNGGATIHWNDDPSGFRGRNLMFGSGTADNVVTLTNNIDAQNQYRVVQVFDNPNSTADKALLSGTISNLSGFEKQGDGTLEMHGFATIGDQVRVHGGGTLKVSGNLQAGALYTESDPRYVGSALNQIEVYDNSRLLVIGNVQASVMYGDGNTANSIQTTGDVTLRGRWEQNGGTGHVGGNLQTGDDHIYLRNATVLTVDGSLRSGTPDRDIYLWQACRLNIGGDLKANYLYAEQAAPTGNGQLPGITVGGNLNINGQVDLRTGSSTVAGNLTTNDNLYVRYGADLTVAGNLTANYLEASEYDYWYGTGRVSNIHLNGASAVINGGSGNISINANNPTAGYGVLDGVAAVSANGVYLWNKAKLGGNLTLNVLDKVEIGGNSVIAPGSPVGTLTINGNLQLDDGAICEFGGGDLVSVSGTLTAGNGWTLKLQADGQHLATGGSMTLMHCGTVGSFNHVPSYDVSALVAASWLPAGFDVGALSLSVNNGNVVLNGLHIDGAALSSYASWATDMGISGQPASGDSNHDGVANAVAMVLGVDPKGASKAAWLPTLALVTNPLGVPAGKYLEFTYRRTALSVAAGVTATCQYSSGLDSAWINAQDGVSGVKVLTTTDYFASGIDRVRAYVPSTGHSALFGRLQVTVP